MGISAFRRLRRRKAWGFRGQRGNKIASLPPKTPPLDAASQRRGISISF